MAKLLPHVSKEVGQTVTLANIILVDDTPRHSFAPVLIPRVHLGRFDTDSRFCFYFSVFINIFKLGVLNHILG